MPSSFEQTTDDYDLLNTPPFLNRPLPSNKPRPPPPIGWRQVKTWWSRAATIN